MMPNQEVSELRNRILGIRIRTARDQARISRRECAAAIGVSVNRFAGYESGQRAISLPELEMLARYLEVTLNTFREDASVNEGEPEEEQLPNPNIFLPLRQRIVGARLKQLRINLNRTQKDLANILGCSSSSMSDYEYGRRAIPLADLEILCRALDVSLDYFVDHDSEVGLWHKRQMEYDKFTQLPSEVKEFILRPINRSYLELAIKLSKMPANSLRSIAEGLLEITY
ncbi:MAG: helix-turn-helix transcriptional regulator [Anaerolineae bacterium]|nr:helix-turn-helix transcriptional regulator [Anaerolineae bacterium]